MSTVPLNSPGPELADGSFLFVYGFDLDQNARFCSPGVSMPADLSDWLGDGRARSRRSFFWNEKCARPTSPFCLEFSTLFSKLPRSCLGGGHVMGSLNGTLVYIMGISGTSRSPRQDI